MFKAFILATLIALPSPQEATNFLSCTPTFNGGDPVYISLDSKPWEGTNLSCIRTMAAEGETCALNGGYSRLYASGTARIRDVFDHVMQIGGHAGNFVSFSMSDRNIRFSGGHFNGQDTWSQRWSFNVNRITGSAALEADQELGITEGEYRCIREQRKF
jgi:hypothetical protein